MNSARIHFNGNFDGGQDSLEILWSEFAPTDLLGDSRIISLPELVASNAGEIREEIIGGFEALYDSVKATYRLKVFEVEEGLNYWRMGFPGDLPLLEDSYVYDLARLIELFRIVEKEEITDLHLLSAPTVISKVVTEWSISNGINVNVLNGLLEASAPSIFRQKFKQEVRRVRRLVGAFRLLGAYLMRYGLKFRYRVPASVKPDSDVWMSYLARYQIEMSNKFIDSGFWGRLPSVLESKKYTANRLFIDIPLDTGPTLSQKRLDLGLATSASPTASYSLIQDFMTARALWKTLRTFFRLFRIGIKIQSKKFTLPLDRGKFDAFPLIEAYWQSLWSGSSAMMNAIWIGLFNEFFRYFSPKRAFIPMENQAWERAFIHGARRKEKCDVLGFVHSQVRFWDLRYFHPSGKSAKELWDTSSPTGMVVGSQKDRLLLLQGGISERELIDAEALRFCSDIAPGSRSKLDLKNNIERPLSVLVLGDYDNSYSREQLEFANELAKHLQHRVRVTFRPHPSSIQHSVNSYQLVKISRHDRINDALRDADLVVCGHLSASILNAQLAAVPVLAMPNPKYLCDRDTIGNKELLKLNIRNRAEGEAWLREALENSSRDGIEDLDRDIDLPKWLGLVLGHSDTSH